MKIRSELFGVNRLVISIVSGVQSPQLNKLFLRRSDGIGRRDGLKIRCE